MYLVTIDTGDRLHSRFMDDEEYFGIDEESCEGEVVGTPFGEVRECTAQEFLQEFGKFHYDQRGQLLSVGRTVLFPVRHGSSCWLERGTVKEVTANGMIRITAEKTNAQNSRLAKDVVAI